MSRLVVNHRDRRLRTATRVMTCRYGRFPDRACNASVAAALLLAFTIATPIWACAQYPSGGCIHGLDARRFGCAPPRSCSGVIVNYVEEQHIPQLRASSTAARREVRSPVGQEVACRAESDDREALSCSAFQAGTSQLPERSLPVGRWSWSSTGGALIPHQACDPN